MSNLSLIVWLICTLILSSPLLLILYNNYRKDNFVEQVNIVKDGENYLIQKIGFDKVEYLILSKHYDYWYWYDDTEMAFKYPTVEDAENGYYSFLDKKYPKPPKVIKKLK